MSKELRQETAESSPKISVLLLLALAGCEGAAVMALELITGQLLSPSFGDSLTTWMWILICTMAGLALGYFAGACFRTGSLRIVQACWALLAGLTYVALIPSWITALVSRLLELSPAVAVPIAAASILLVPMALFGLVPGFLVCASRSIQSESSAGRAGVIFAFSTCGGIVSAFLVGLVLVPTFGVTLVLRSLSLVLGLATCFVLIFERCYREVLLAVVVGLVVLPTSRKDIKGNGDVRILDFQEGLMGQLMVADEKEANQEQYRYLYVNRTGQTRMKLGGQFAVRDQFEYVQSLASVLATAPPKSRVLLLGLGGGGLVKLLRGMDLDVTVVEIDPRIVSLAKRFFDLPPDVKVEVGDARRYLRLTDRTYDIVVYDVFRGEFLPAHVLTREAIESLKEKLAPGGMVLINVIGANSGPLGSVPQAIVKTLRAAGLRCTMIAPKSQLNTIIVADAGDRSYTARVNNNSIVDGFPLAESLFIASSSIDAEQSAHPEIPVLTDDLPVIDQLNRSAVRMTRDWYIRTAVKRHLKNEVPLFR